MLAYTPHQIKKECKNEKAHKRKISKTHQTVTHDHTPSVGKNRKNFPTARKRQPMKIELANPGS